MSLSGKAKTFNIAIIYALLGACFYGVVPPFARGAFVQGIPALENTMVRTAFMAITLIPLAALMGRQLRIPRAAQPAFFLQALATLIVSICYLASLQFIPVGLAVIIFFSFPVLIVLLSSVVERQPLNVWRMASVALAFLGLALAIGPSIDGLDWRGIVLASMAALGAVLQSFSGRMLAERVSALVSGGLVHGAVLPFTIIAALWAGHGELRLVSAAALPMLAYVYLAALSLAYCAAYFSHMNALSNAPASFVMPFFNIEPIVSTACAAYLFGERLSVYQYGGGALVLAALLLVGLAKKGEN